MNYYQPREKTDGNGNGTGLWHYTCKNDGRIWPVGYCSPWETCPDCKGHSIVSIDAKCDKCENRGVIKRENPCPGHKTPEEAAEHYRQYKLDNVRYDGKYHDEMRKCEICGNWTEHFALIDYRSYALCDEHRNRENLEKVFPLYGNYISSE